MARQDLVRRNERIRAREVRLIGADGKQVGIVSREEALDLARQSGLDLVEISASANPPVCRILDYGKYAYELSKKQKETKAKAASAGKLKEIKFRARIEEHDYMTKIRRAEEFLFKGNKLKISLMFRGREMEHTEIGFEVVARAIRDLAHVGHADSEARLNGRFINQVMTPVPQGKRLLKHNESVSDEDLEDDLGDEDTED